MEFKSVFESRSREIEKKKQRCGVQAIYGPRGYYEY
jgi:hypothetical protein